MAGGLYLLNQPRTVRVVKADEEIQTKSVEKVPVLDNTLKPVCACESSYEGGASGTPQQFEKDGVTVRYGRVNPADRGMCQINATIHRDSALKLGMDIETTEGNIKFANYLYKTQGLSPWAWSKPCWDKKK